MTSKSVKKLTDAQLQMLRSVRDFDNPWQHIRGQSAHGGATSTLHFLTNKKKFVEFVNNQWRLTAEGRVVLESTGTW